MDYKRTYQLLIDKRRNNPLPDGEYGEVHHIVPKSEGGSDEPNNLVKLTAREHYVAHLLLARIYNDFKMWSAVIYMRTGRHKGRNFNFNSRLYDKAKKEFGKRHSEHLKMLVRTTNYGEKISRAKKGKPAPNKGKPCSEGQKEKLRQANLGKKHSEETNRKQAKQMKGRKVWNNGVEQVFTKECPEGFVAGLLPSTKRKLSQANTGKKLSEETKIKIGLGGLGRIPWNKGKHCPEEAKQKMRESISKLKWWNNGKEECRAIEPPDGWIAGRLKTKKEVG